MSADAKLLETVEPPQLGELIASLIGSRYTRPVTVQVQTAEPRLFLEFVVTKIESRFANEGLGAPSDLPDYEFSGWLYKSGFDLFPGTSTVQGRLFDARGGFHHMCEIAVIPSGRSQDNT